MVTVAEDHRLAYSVDDLARVCGVGRTKLFEAIKEGRLKARKSGRSTVVLRPDAEAFLRSLPEREPVT